MAKRIFAFLRRLLFTLGIVGLLGVVLPRLITTIHCLDRIYQKEDAPNKRVAIVFGAGLRRDGTPTPILRDRVDTAANLYFSGKVEKLLMSGDNQFLTTTSRNPCVNTPFHWASQTKPLSLDYAGRRTYDTCYRAKAIFEVDDALLVTQKFHLPRALFLCNALGLQALGVEANNTRQFWRGSTFDLEFS